MSREVKKITSYILSLAMIFTTIFSNGIVASASDDSADGSTGEVTVTADENGNRTFKLTGDVADGYEIELQSGETAVLDGQGYTITGKSGSSDERTPGLSVKAAEGAESGNQTIIIKNINIKGAEIYFSEEHYSYYDGTVGMSVGENVNIIFEDDVNITAGGATAGDTQGCEGSDGLAGIEFNGNNMSVTGGSSVSVKASDAGESCREADGADGGTAIKFTGDVFCIGDGAKLNATAGNGSYGYNAGYFGDSNGIGGNGGSVIELTQGTLDISEDAEVTLSVGEAGDGESSKGTDGSRLSYKSGYVSDRALLVEVGVTDYKTVILSYLRGEDKVKKKSFYTTLDTVTNVKWLPEYDIEGTDGNSGWEVSDDTSLDTYEFNNFMLRYKTASYTVTFDTVGGSEVAVQTVDWNTKAVKPETDPTKEGYTFAGWYADKEYNTEYDFETAVKENVTIYAKWTINTFKVTFDTAGGSEVAGQTVDWNTKAVKPETDPVKEGYTFAGWYADKEYKTAYDFATAVKVDTTVYAKWTINTFKVTFDTVGGSEVAVQTVNWNTKAVKPETDPTKEGYTFAGWYADKEYKTAYDFATAVKEDVTVYARWTINTFKVTFDTVGGSEVAVQTVDWNTQAVKPETDPTKEGYTFAGWYADKEYNAEYDFKTAVKEDVTVYAKWTINTFKVTFDTAGGSEVSSQTVDWNTQAVKPETDPTKEGYTFAGWYADKEYNAEYDFKTAVKEDVTVYAKWTINTFKVTFDTAGGSEVAGQTVDWNTQAVKPETDPVKEGYTFAGWYADKEYKTVYDFATAVKEDVTVYAKWTINTYKVTFDTAGGSEVADQTVDWNTQAVKPETDPTKEGYTFAGWYADKEYNAEYDFKVAIKEDTTVYAKWTINTYKVTFDTAGGSEVADQTVDWNTQAVKPETNPTKEGYTFAGWYADKEYNAEYDFKAAIKEDVTVYAKWTINTYKVSFNSQGGSSVKSQKVEYNGIAQTPETPVRKNCGFGGWYTDRSFTQKYDFSAPVTQNVRLYAKWYKASANVGSVEVMETKTVSTVKIKVASGDKIKKWKSSDTKTVKVDSKGNITGVKKGKATITVTTSKGASVTVKVTVKKLQIPAKKIKVSNVKNGKLTIERKKKFTLNVVITPSDSTDSIKYSSSDKKVATVNKNGKITAVKKGKANITITSGNIKKVIKVTVK